MSNLQLSEEQTRALREMEIFLLRPGGGIFILKGYAGTGKTTLLKYVADHLDKKKINFILLAPTGRAASVLKDKTGYITKTVHSQLYKFADVDGEPDTTADKPTIDQYGQMQLKFDLIIPDANKDTPSVYIIDEASMLSDELAEPTSYATFGTGHLLSDLLYVAGDRKIIFCGDPAQLPPVGSNQSPAMSEAWFRSRKRTVYSFEMSSIHRQAKESGILVLATKVRKITQLSTYPKWLKLPARNTPQVNMSYYQYLVKQYVNDVVQNGAGNRIAICHSNRNCNDINHAVRKTLYNDPVAPLQVGDVLMVTQNNFLVPLKNGDFVEVVSVGEKFSYCGIGFVHVSVYHKPMDKTYHTLLCMDPLFNGRPNLTQDQQRVLMIDFSQRMRKKGIKPRSVQYFHALEVDPYLNSLRANFGYAVTCQKSQGGEWNDVYLFLHKGMYTMDAHSLSRWWYTGITRARERLWLVEDWWIE